MRPIKPSPAFRARCWQGRKKSHHVLIDFGEVTASSCLGWGEAGNPLHPGVCQSTRRLPLVSAPPLPEPLPLKSLPLLA